MGLNDIMARLKSPATDINVVSKNPKRDKEIEQELRASLLYLGFKAEDICHWLIDTDALLMRVMMTNKNKFKMIIKYKIALFCKIMYKIFCTIKINAYLYSVNKTI